MIIANLKIFYLITIHLNNNGPTNVCTKQDHNDARPPRHGDLDWRHLR